MIENGSGTERHRGHCSDGGGERNGGVMMEMVVTMVIVRVMVVVIVRVMVVVVAMVMVIPRWAA